MTLARDIQPGQTILCNGTPSYVWKVYLLDNGKAMITFLTVNEVNVRQWIIEGGQDVTVDPLAPVRPYNPNQKEN